MAEPLRKIESGTRQNLFQGTVEPSPDFCLDFLQEMLDAAASGQV